MIALVIIVPYTVLITKESLMFNHLNNGTSIPKADKAIKEGIRNVDGVSYFEP